MSEQKQITAAKRARGDNAFRTGENRHHAPDAGDTNVPLQERKHIGRRGPRDLPVILKESEIQLASARWPTNADARNTDCPGRRENSAAPEGPTYSQAGVETVALRDMERLSLLKPPRANSLAIVETPRYARRAEPRQPGTIVRLADWSASPTSSARRFRPLLQPEGRAGRWARDFCGCGSTPIWERFLHDAAGRPFGANIYARRYGRGRVNEGRGITAP